ncbi:intracellular chloride channel [Aureococcus anophagefferens]|nr:intracellular chloride channel [Aureococcus anophagefferens]
MGSIFSKADDGKKKKDDDGYMEPQQRARPAPESSMEIRSSRAEPHAAAAELGVDGPDIAPSTRRADKYDYLIVFENSRPKKPKEADGDPDALAAGPEVDMVSWSEVELIWFQAIPGEEDKKNKGVRLLLRDWEARFGKVDDARAEVPRWEFLNLADALDYKFKFKDEVDPGIAFWRRSSRNDREGRPIYTEIAEEQVMYERFVAQEILEGLYKVSKIGPNDMGIFEDDEPSKKHWSRRIHTLERIVDRVPVSNPYAAYAAFDNQAKERHLFDEYPSVRGKTLFLPKDRLYLTKRIIDEVFDFGVLKEKDVVGGLHALHDANYGEMPTTDWFQKRWVFFWNSESDRIGAPYLSHYAIEKGRRCPWYLKPWSQPLMEIRSYYGEKIALYFAWLSFYGYMLMMPAIAGLLALLYTSAFDVDDEAKGIHYDQFLMAVFLVVWSAYYKEQWDIESQYCAVKWGTLNFEEEEADRPQFVGDEDQPRRISPITNQNETYYPPERRFKTQTFSVTSLYELGGVWASLADYVTIFQSLLIQVMSYLYGIQAEIMNNHENYQTQTAYENNLITKKFCFEIFNNYSALAITAFFKGVYFECTDDDCLGDLYSLLVSIMGTPYALNILSAFSTRIKRAIEYFMPPTIEDDDSDDEEDEENGKEEKAAEAPRFEAELKLDDSKSTLDDFAEIVLQMGLVTMFTLGWYSCRCWARARSCCRSAPTLLKMTPQVKRPDPMPAETVGSWGMLMESMGLLAVYCNSAIIVFTTHSLNTYNLLQKVIIFFVLEQVILALKIGMHAYIDDEPTALNELKRRQAFVVNRHKNVVFDDDEDDDDDGAPCNAVDADSLSVAALRTEKMNRPTMMRLEYLRRRLLICDKNIKEMRDQFREAQAVEHFREDLGVSYSRRNPELALGMVNFKVESAQNVGSPQDPVDAASTRVIVHVSKPAKKPRGSAGAGRHSHLGSSEDGSRLVFDMNFSLAPAPVKTIHAEVYAEVADDSKKLRRGWAKLELADLADQYTHALYLDLNRPGLPFGAAPAPLKVTAQFQYSRSCPSSSRSSSCWRSSASSTAT